MIRCEHGHHDTVRARPSPQRLHRCNHERPTLQSRDAVQDRPATHLPPVPPPAARPGRAACSGIEHVFAYSCSKNSPSGLQL